MRKESVIIHMQGKQPELIHSCPNGGEEDRGELGALLLEHPRDCPLSDVPAGPLSSILAHFSPPFSHLPEGTF